MDISVVICTWNRADLLRATLEQMCNLRIPSGVSWELLVVNNNSTDHTDSVIASYVGRLPIRGLVEPRQGVCPAANCALAAAKGDLIIWTADDVLVDSEWLVAYSGAMREWPDAAFFGGPVFPWYESQPPAWLEDSKWVLRGVLAIKNYDDTVRPFVQEEGPIGNNLAIRRSINEQFPFDETLGYVGNRLGGGEDMDVLDRMTRAGMTGIWVGTAKIRHWVPRKRMTYKYIWDWSFAGGVQQARTGRIPGRSLLGMPLSVVRRWLRGLRLWVSGWIRRDAPRHVKGWCDLAWQMGIVWGGMRKKARWLARRQPS
jgi:glycosyltransferase involved in cell wall biosynthesis